VLWAIADEIRLLALISEAQAAGESHESLMRRQQVFGDRARGLVATLKRRRGTDWIALLREAHRIDRLIKGIPTPGSDADPWRALARLALQVC
jgi:DNA polymerase-3 subunit delta